MFIDIYYRDVTHTHTHVIYYMYILMYNIYIL